jgi:hypothetical protein
MSVIAKLHTTFSMMETVAFIEWRQATPERKEEITRELGILQGQMILDEIEEETTRKFPCPNE